MFGCVPGLLGFLFSVFFVCKLVLIRPILGGLISPFPYWILIHHVQQLDENSLLQRRLQNLLTITAVVLAGCRSAVGPVVGFVCFPCLHCILCLQGILRSVWLYSVCRFNFCTATVVCYVSFPLCVCAFLVGGPRMGFGLGERSLGTSSFVLGCGLSSFASCPSAA